MFVTKSDEIDDPLSSSRGRGKREALDVGIYAVEDLLPSVTGAKEANGLIEYTNIYVQSLAGEGGDFRCSFNTPVLIQDILIL